MAYIPLSRLHQVPEQIQKNPEFTMLGELPSWVLFVRHVKGRFPLLQHSFQEGCLADG
ncbi:MAG: hypothetical protein IJZ40_07345 [Bacteroidaceae bacterium]|nr:hypothetical protein [Bacteroidaceae bacterium]